MTKPDPFLPILQYVRHTFPSKAYTQGRILPTDALTVSEARFYAPPLRELSDHFNGIERLAATNYFNLKPYRAAYLLYFFPSNWAKIHHVLHRSGLLPETREQIPQDIRILDLGSGPAPLSLGALSALHTRARDLGQESTALPKAYIDCVDQSKPVLQDAIELAKRLFSRETVTLKTSHDSIFSHRLPTLTQGPYDWIVLGDFLNEIDPERHEKLIQRICARYLKVDGALILLEPALRKTSRSLQILRDRLVESAPEIRLTSPCLRLGSCPLNHYNQRDWCHFYADWTPPSWMALLEKTAGLSKEILKYSYLTFKADKLEQNKTETKVSDEKRGLKSPHLWRVISNPMRSKGKQESVWCGPQGRLHVTGQFKHKTEQNGDFFHLHRGDLVEIIPKEWPLLAEHKESWDYRASLDLQQQVRKR